MLAFIAGTFQGSKGLNVRKQKCCKCLIPVFPNLSENKMWPAVKCKHRAQTANLIFYEYYYTRKNVTLYRI